MAKLAVIVALAAGDVGLRPGGSSPDEYAAALMRRLAEAGLSIHANDGRCVRPGPVSGGREMTEDEMVALGVRR